MLRVEDCDSSMGLIDLQQYIISKINVCQYDEPYGKVKRNAAQVFGVLYRKNQHCLFISLTEKYIKIVIY